MKNSIPGKSQINAKRPATKKGKPGHLKQGLATEIREHAEDEHQQF
jgi:hypothetical protein